VTACAATIRYHRLLNVCSNSSRVTACTEPLLRPKRMRLYECVLSKELAVKLSNDGQLQSNSWRKHAPHSLSTTHTTIIAFCTTTLIALGASTLTALSLLLAVVAPQRQIHRLQADEERSCYQNTVDLEST
jgi:hypothetical protein